MNPVQIVNGVAALLAAILFLQAMPRTMTMGSRAATVATASAFGVAAVFAVLSFALGTGAFDLGSPRAVPIFSYGFPVIAIAPAARSYFLYRQEKQMFESAGIEGPPHVE